MASQGRPKEHGVTILEVMVALGIAMIVISGFYTFYLRFRSNIDEIAYASTMRNLADNIRNTIQNPEVLSFTASTGNNPDFERCIWTDPALRNDRPADQNPQACTATNPMQQVPLNIYRSPAKKGTFDLASLRLAGTEADPVWYDIKGHPGCKPSERQCVFMARAYFWATCPPSSAELRETVKSSKRGGLYASKCFRAQTVNVRVQLVHAFEKGSFAAHDPSAPPQGKESRQSPLLRQLPAVPNDASFWRGGQRGRHNTNHARAISVSSLGLWGDHSEKCPTNFTLLGLADSKPVCQCLPPFRKVNEQTCILSDHRCSKGQRYKGTDLSGRPICTNVSCQKRTVRLEEEKGFAFDCKPHGWLNKIQTIGSKGCRCKGIAESPDPEIGTWSYSCALHCEFIVTCCREI